MRASRGAVHTSHCHLYLKRQEEAVNIDHRDEFAALREEPEQHAGRLHEQEKSEDGNWRLRIFAAQGGRQCE